nr:D-alanyl-D-alanine carboxypeptidase [Kiloniellales bacterium]
WGFREFNNYALFKAGESVETADVWLGDAMNVPLTSPEDIVVTLPRKARKDMAVTVIYEQPVPAPIQEGDQIGILRVTAPEVAPREFPLYAGHSVEQLGPFGRVVSALMYFVTGAP